MTTEQILTAARNKLLESGTEIISDATLLLYANLAYTDVIKRSFPNSNVASATIAFTAGSGTLPSDFGTLYTDATDTNENIFPEVSISDFVRRLQTEDYAVTIEGGAIKASPTTTASLDIKYYTDFPTLTSVVNPTIDDYLHEPIIYGAIARAFEDLQYFEASQYYAKKFDALLTEKNNALSNYEEDAQRGNVLFEGIRII